MEGLSSTYQSSQSAVQHIPPPAFIAGFTGESDWKPVGRYLMVRPTVLPSVTDGGIHIPESATRKPNSGTILSKGAQCSDTFSNGDTVFWPEHEEYKLVLDDTKELVYVVLEDNILLHKPRA